MENEMTAMPDASRPSASFLDVIYETLFCPWPLFNGLGSAPEVENHWLFTALLLVIFISALTPVLQLINTGGELTSLVWGIPLAVVAGVFAWGAVGLVIALLGYAFGGSFCLKRFLALSGFATTPWLLMGPISLFKAGLGGWSLGLFILGALLIWLWSILLFGLAFMATYRMTVERVLIVLFMPLVASVIFLSWVFGFLDNVSQLMLPL